MKRTLLVLGAIAAIVIACQQQQPTKPVAAVIETPLHELNGFESKVAWGEHLVTISGCDDCHSPKKMTDRGPMPDMEVRLSGHRPTGIVPNLDRAAIEANGYGACNPEMTAWVGPWGVSFASNLSSDATGIGNWTEEQFFKAMREGKYKGMDGTRPLLPPMPWQNFAQMTDEEISAIFAFLKSTKPIENIVPAPQLPLAAKS